MSVDFYFDGAAEGETANLSNANASRVLRSLGLAFDYCGQVDAADLKGRILTAIAVGGVDIVDTADHASKGLTALLGAGGACVHDCTPPLDEYLARRLPDLLVVAEAAEKAGQPVTWA